MYVWNQDQVGKGTRVNLLLGGGPGFVGQPSYSAELRMLFEGHVAISHDGRQIGDGVGAFTIDSRCRFRYVWKRRVGYGNEPPPMIIGQVVFAPGGDAGGYTLLAARTGRVLWRFPTPNSTYAPAIAAGGRIFAGEMDGTVHAFVPGPKRR
jgi:outer membrane protein assembly factor BamB